jgi:DNA modification methylase
MERLENNRQPFLYGDSDVSARQFNILRSPKKNGTAQSDSAKYLKELNVEIVESKQPIQFSPNTNESVHRWSPYVQGFSASFVQNTLDKYKSDYTSPIILDPFAGSGTVIVQTKMNGFKSFGVELNPLLHFIGTTKINSWQTSPLDFLQAAETLPTKHKFQAPEFLKSSNQFNPKVLRNLEIIKSGIDSLKLNYEQDKQIRNLLLLAFASILIDCSNLKRSPCLGYSPTKKVADDAPFHFFRRKIQQIAEDLWSLQGKYRDFILTESQISLGNSMTFEHQEKYDLAVTSPPYMNGLDYVINYKIEMGWLGFADNHKELKTVKDEMVVCDNVSKGLIQNFALQKERYTNSWIDEIKEEIAQNIEKRGAYRRNDMPEIVHKYFDDMHKIMKNVVSSLKNNGRFILVVGDSLIADVYLPTDLILAKIGKELGLEIESIEKARDRRSGQIRSYKLRETIITLKKQND